jgi:hypothetical protein
MDQQNHQLWVDGQERAMQCAVIVKSIQVKKELGKRKSIDPISEYNHCAGFIVETKGPEAYIAVHESQIDLVNTFYVSFAGGDFKLATVLLKKTDCQFVILGASLEGEFRKVRTKKMFDRGDLLMLSVGVDNLVPLYTSIINPNTECVSVHDLHTIAGGSDDVFTFGGYTGDVVDILGAPLFARDGYLVGTVFGDESTLPEHHPEGEFCLDLKYALKAWCFLNELKNEIKGKLEPKGNKPRNNRRR